MYKLILTSINFKDLVQDLFDLVTTAGSSACLTMPIKQFGVISGKFYKSHICVLKNGIPADNDLPKFCKDFRPGVRKNHVMMLTKDELNQLVADLRGHQGDFGRLSGRFAGNPSNIHFYTDDTYNFVECNKKGSDFKAHVLKGLYGRYVPKAVRKVTKARRSKKLKTTEIYQIYHGCAPSHLRPGFSASGSC